MSARGHPPRVPEPAPHFDSLLDTYAKYRTGYSKELYDLVLAQVAPRPRVLDVGAGTGLATRGLAASSPPPRRLVATDIARRMLAQCPAGERVLAAGERLPFRDASFDLATCAQAFHWLDPPRAYDELWRVLAPGGVAALWWKYEHPDDETALAADAAFERVVGKPAPATVFETAPLPDVERSPFGREDRRVVPWSLAFTVESYVGYHASRENLRRGAGPLREKVLEEMTRALSKTHPSGRFEIPYVQRVSFLRKPP
jgi:SAM-dependent methyltransferase